MPTYAETFVLLDSPPQEFVGGGLPRRLDTRDGAFAASLNFVGGVSIAFHGTSSFAFDIAAPAGERIRVGSYEKAARFPFQPADRPGLSATSEGRGCNALGGRFVVLEASYDADGQIQRFAADFAQHCERGGTLLGSVRFNSPVPVRDGDLDGVIDIKDNCPASPNVDQSDVDADGIGSVCDPVQGVTAIVLESEAGDVVGAGRPLAFGPQSGIRAFRNLGGGVSLRVADVSLDFGPAPDRAFGPGVFAAATRFPFQDQGEPGLSVFARGRGCNALGGRFEVLELRLAPDGEVLNLAIDFEQRCEGDRAALSGIVRLNSEVVGAPELDVDADGVINLADDCPMDRNPDQSNRDGDELGDACDPYPDQRDNLQACQVQSDGERALRDVQEETLATLLGRSEELHSENLTLRQENERLRAALVDADGDGVVAGLDQCAQSPSSAAVDASGCTRAQFCARIPVVSLAAGFRCFASGFVGEGPFRSCTVDLGDRTGGVRCVAR
jgi:hypothetical protein